MKLHKDSPAENNGIISLFWLAYWQHILYEQHVEMAINDVYFVHLRLKISLMFLAGNI